MPKVSLIVSAYNIEAYMKKCLQSLINQTLKDIEIVVVNDGSVDDTLQKIKQMQDVDKRITIINQGNEGVMRARETGFKRATGEYLLFVDGDDWLAEDAIEILYNKAKQEDYDIVCYKFYHADGHGVKKSSSKNTNYPLLTGDHFLKMVMTNKINPPLWSKLMKKEFILNNNVVFPNGIAKAQDLAFACSLGIHHPKVCLIDEYLYFYFTSRDTSVTNTISKLLEVDKATFFIKQQLKNNFIYLEYKEEYEFLAFIHNFWFNVDVMYKNKHYLSRTLYKKWKNMKINIIKNKHYKELIIEEKLKTRIILMILIRNYSLGRLIYKLYNSYSSLTRKAKSI